MKTMLMLAAATLALLSAPAEGAEKWLVACRADGYCAASTADGEGAILRIGRPARQTYWEVSIDTHVQPDPLTPFSATVDRRGAIEFPPGTGVAPFGRPSDFFFLGRKAQTLLDRLVPGRRLTIGYTGANGSPGQSHFDLAGLPQALIAIDTRQHRIGSERVAETPSYGLFRTDVPGATWMRPALVERP